MINNKNAYDRPIEIAENIFWVGFDEKTLNYHCNPYLIIEGQQAVLIDAGSRPDFAVVMMKILQTGIFPDNISALIYHHPDPDLCGSMSNMVDICDNPELKILSDSENNIFLSHYIERGRRHLLESINDRNFTYAFGGRTLEFFKTPYAHSCGSFITYDRKTKTLFTSDIFGGISPHWELFGELTDDCFACKDYGNCIRRRKYCPLSSIIDFHKKVFPSDRALHRAMDTIKRLDVALIAPQHGSIFANKKDIDFIIEFLGSMTGVGIDGISP